MAKAPKGIAVIPVRAHYTRCGKYVRSYYRAGRVLRRALGKKA